MRLSATTLIATTLLGSQLVAQDFIGFSYNGQISFTSRGFLGFGATAGEVMTRISGQDYAGYGTNTPGTRTISSLFFIVQDQNAVTTPEVFNIKLYPESLANPGFPDLAAGVTFATGVAGPAAPTTGVVSAAQKVVTPTTAVSVPIVGNGDIFVSWVLPASPTASNADGLSIQALNGNAAAPTAVMDVPGPNMFPQTPAGPANSRGITLTLPSTLTYSVAREWFFDAAHAGAGGAALAVTNQTTLIGSNNPVPTGFGPAPGTASFLSGTHPDANGNSVGRADDISFDFFMTGLGTGQTVLFLLDGNFGPTFGIELPISAFFPGSSGSTCLVDYGTFGPFFGSALSNADEAFTTIPIPAFLRPLMPGLTVKQQAAAIVGTNFVASPCAAQHF